jgi:hypothetical protein
LEGQVIDTPVNEIQKRVAQALGQMNVRELYKLFDASSSIMDQVGGRYVDETVLRKFKALSPSQQVRTLRQARKLAEFVWHVVGDFELADLADQADTNDIPTTETIDEDQKKQETDDQ